MYRAVPGPPNMDQALQIIDFIDGSLKRQATMVRLFGTATGRQHTPAGLIEVDFSTSSIVSQVNETITAIRGIRLIFDEPGGEQVHAVLHKWHGPNPDDRNKHIWDTSIGRKRGVELFDHLQLREGILQDLALISSPPTVLETEPIEPPVL